MPVTLVEMQATIHQEYANLLGRLGLSAIPLDVYEVSAGGGFSGHGTDLRNATPVYTPSLIVLPQLPDDLAEWAAVHPAFPPSTWTPGPPEWLVWRIDLWHEVVHQYQEKILRQWDPHDGDDGHRLGWPGAIAAVAAALAVGPAALKAVL